MRMHELFTFTVTLCHQEADQFRRLTQDNDTITVIGMKAIDDDRVDLTVGCSDATTRDRLVEAW